MSELTQAQLKEVLHYDHITGIFTWIQPRKSVKAGSVAGTIMDRGYRQIRCYGSKYLAHRLAWLYMTGDWPPEAIDHIDGDPFNNAWSNLREATIKQNQENQRLHKRNTSGFRGVRWHKLKQKWQASVGHCGKLVNLGYYTNPEEAADVAAAKRKELYSHDTGRDRTTLSNPRPR